MGKINVLSKDLANKIAAGEVIERPASVVKELTDNSIDAGATKIEISVSANCRDIRIADNGSGIAPEDLEKAFLKHATSKILTEEDLWKISTMGFRGEALASICSVADVTCTSAVKGEPSGFRAIAKNSEVTKSPAACSVGTVMEVDNLFECQPARLKFLKSEKTEISYIKDCVKQAALGNPSIGFSLFYKGSKILSTLPGRDLATRICEIYSNEISDILVKVEKHDVRFKTSISGYVTQPSFPRANRKDIHIYVNSRPVKCPVILKAIDTAYKNLLPHGKYPLCVLNVEVPFEDIDVNVHPQKREIRYKNPNFIFAFVISAVESALVSKTYAPAEPEPVKRIENISQIFESTDAQFVSQMPEPSYAGAKIVPMRRDFSEQKTFAPKLLNIKPEQPRPAESNDRIIGQFADTYILIENENGLEIVDQHIADERYLYEKFSSQKQTVSQILFVSTPVELEPEQVQLLKDASEKLQKFGYEFEFLSDTRVMPKKIPQILSSKNTEDIVRSLVENIHASTDFSEEKILITTACKAAVKAGEKLSIWQAEELIKRWRATKHPQVCPHGRPISKIIPKSTVASFFNRTDKP